MNSTIKDNQTNKLLLKNIKITNYSYYKWFIAAVEVAIIWGIVVVVVNWIFYRENLKRLTQGLKNNR